MEHCFLYHCNAYTYGDPTWFPDMDPKLREMFDQVTKGSLSGKAGEAVKEDWKSTANMLIRQIRESWGFLHGQVCRAIGN